MATATTLAPSAEKIATPRFALTERELKEYSLSRAILTSAENQDGIERNCLELEISQTIEKANRSGTHGGIFIPWNIGAGSFARKVPRIEKRAGLDSATATKGGELKFTKPGDFL